MQQGYNDSSILLPSFNTVVIIKSNNNETIATIPNSAVIILISMLSTSGFFGMIFNLGLISLGAINANLRVDYSWFLFVIAGFNFVYCFHNAFMQTFAIATDMHPGHPFCHATAFILVAYGIAPVMTQPLLALNRYSTMFYRTGHANRFCRRNIFLMIIAVHAIAFAVGTAFTLFNDYGKLNGTICSVDVSVMPLLHFVLLLFLPMNLSQIICIFCAVKVTRLIKSNQKFAQQQNMRDKINETKQLITLMYIEIVVPVLLESPVLILCVAAHYLTIPVEILAIAIGLFVTHAATDPIIVILVMKPYREALKKLIGRVSKKPNQVKERTVVFVL